MFTILQALYSTFLKPNILKCFITLAILAGCIAGGYYGSNYLISYGMSKALAINVNDVTDRVKKIKDEYEKKNAELKGQLDSVQKKLTNALTMAELNYEKGKQEAEVEGHRVIDEYVVRNRKLHDEIRSYRDKITRYMVDRAESSAGQGEGRGTTKGTLRSTTESEERRADGNTELMQCRKELAKYTDVKSKEPSTGEQKKK